MADYWTPTVVEPDISDIDITPLERLLLSCIFECERYDGVTYFFSEQGPSDMIYLARSKLAEALAASEAVECSANAFVKEQLAAADGEIDEVELDMSGPGWQFLFQDIIRRSCTITAVTVKMAFTCSRMRPDGFGGMAMLITANAVMAKSTGELLDEFAAEAKASDSFRVRPHIEPMLIMSTAHLSVLDRAYLDSGKGTVIANRRGWIVYTKQEIFPGMMPLLDFAAAQGCLWIKFDADGPEFEEFPTFDWQ